ncbi:MAG: glycine cleavage system protein H [Actinomycetota bacterium]|nr:glycine cleavage system protein H [Actinomycetota bacterium]
MGEPAANEGGEETNGRPDSSGSPADQPWVFKNCVLPTNLMYDVEHDLWARVEESGVVRVGLTDVGQTAGGKLQAISFPRSEQRLGKRVAAGKTVALLESAKWVGPIRLPVDAELVEVNADLVPHPLWVNLEPYGRGWVVAFRPESAVPWLSGKEAQDAYRERIGRTFRSVAGVNDDFWCVHCNDWDDL